MKQHKDGVGNLLAAVSTLLEKQIDAYQWAAAQEPVADYDADE